MGSQTMLAPVVLLLWTSLLSVRCQQQRFRVRPANASVVEGDTAVLRCEVHHQVGQLQWAKDGFALGYSRSLPGYSRYRMLGDPGSGVHDLEVRNVTLEDDGRFQCQVSPNRGQAAIRADAFLTVLVPPKAVDITSTALSPSADVYEIKEDRQLTLRCDVTGARPAAVVRWQRNGKYIKLDSDVSFSGYEGSDQNDTTSVVTLRPTAADDGAGFSCVAKHPAIRPEAQRRLNSTVTLSVHYPPAPPVITGTSEGEWTRLGQKKSLTCTSTGGNPAAELVWFRNEQPVTFQYRVKDGSAMALLTVDVQLSDLRAIYRCQASSVVHPRPMLAHAQLNVEFGPENVIVSGTKEAKGGERLRMSCATSSSNPPVNITWVINGRTMMNTTQQHQASEDGGWITSSNISTRVPPGMREDMLVACYALNPRLGTTQVGSAKVSILHPPRPPTILGYEPGTYLRAGERVSLSCIAQGGNPPATLTWYRGDEEVTSDTEVEDGVARSLLTFEVGQQDNRRVYKCDSQNSADSGVQSAGVTLNVLYPPSALKIEVSPKHLRASSQVLLTCESRPSLPAADLTWWRDGQRVTDGVKPMETFKAGGNGGQSSSLQLRKDLAWVDNGAVYECRAHVANISAHLQTKTVLRVTYPPTFKKKLYVENIPVGTSRVINHTASANPGDTVYQWSRVLPIDGSRIVSTGSVLNITSLRREDAGWYDLEATNSEGSTSVRVNIVAHYAPEITSISRVSLVSPGEDCVMECKADANPTTPRMITWRRPGFDFSPPRVKSFYSNGTSYLTVHNVTKQDIGEFQCHVDNGIAETSAAAQLLVTHGVEMVSDARLLKSAADPGETAQLTCRARGVPNVTFEWHRDSINVLASREAHKFSATYSQLDLVTWESVLSIRNIQSADYTAYECLGENALGSGRQEVILQRPSAPDTPGGLKVLNISHDSATLVWEAGFDGGIRQNFRVRYRSKASSDLHYREVPLDANSSLTVTSLKSSVEYSFAVAALNRLGASQYSPEVTAEMSGTPPVSYVTDREDVTKTTFPRLTIVTVTVVGLLLLLLNVTFITCYRRRRHGKSKNAGSEASTKSETLHMYGNETVSSVSVKSGGSYTREDSIDVYDEEGNRRHYDAYLPDGLIDPPAEYGTHSYSPSRVEYAAQAEYAVQARAQSRADFNEAPPPSSPTRAEYDSDTYADALRRNSYACTIGAGVEPMPSQLNTYTTQPPRPPVFRSAPFRTPAPDLLHPSGPSSINGSVPQLSSLQVQQLPTDTRAYSTLPRQRPPAAPGTSSFASGLASPPPIPEAGLEHRGHLV